MYLYLRLRLRVARIFICVLPFSAPLPLLPTAAALWQLYMWQCVIYCSFMTWTRIVHIRRDIVSRSSVSQSHASRLYASQSVYRFAYHVDAHVPNKTKKFIYRTHRTQLYKSSRETSTSTSNACSYIDSNWRFISFNAACNIMVAYGKFVDLIIFASCDRSESILKYKESRCFKGNEDTDFYLSMREAHCSRPKAARFNMHKLSVVGT